MSILRPQRQIQWIARSDVRSEGIPEDLEERKAGAAYAAPKLKLEKRRENLIRPNGKEC